MNLNYKNNKSEMNLNYKSNKFKYKYFIKLSSYYPYIKSWRAKKDSIKIDKTQHQLPSISCIYAWLNINHSYA